MHAAGSRAVWGGGCTRTRSGVGRGRWSTKLSRRIAAGAVVAMLWASGLAAQADSLPAVGDRVRLTDVDGRRATGVVVDASERRIALRQGETVRAFDRSSLTSVERSTGRYRSFGKPLFISTFGSVLFFGLTSAATYEPCEAECWFQPRSRTGAFAEGAVFGGIVVGVPVGLVWALAVKHDRWESLGASDAGAPVKLLLIPERAGRVRVGASLPLFGARAAAKPRD